MICELCGEFSDRRYKVRIEGSVLEVCESCTSLGVKMPESGFKSKSLPKLEEAETDFLVEGFGQAIKRARDQRQWHQRELAQKLNEKESIISKIETGKFEPDAKLARKLEKLLGIKLIE